MHRCTVLRAAHQALAVRQRLCRYMPQVRGEGSPAAHDTSCTSHSDDDSGGGDRDGIDGSGDCFSAHHTATTTATVAFETSVTVVVIVLVACVCRRPSIPHQYSISLPCTHSMWRATRSHPTSRRRRTRSRHTSGGESPRCDSDMCMQLTGCIHSCFVH